MCIAVVLCVIVYSNSIVFIFDVYDTYSYFLIKHKEILNTKCLCHIIIQLIYLFISFLFPFLQLLTPRLTPKGLISAFKGFVLQKESVRVLLKRKLHAMLSVEPMEH